MRMHLFRRDERPIEEHDGDLGSRDGGWRPLVGEVRPEQQHHERPAEDVQLHVRPSEQQEQVPANPKYR